MFVGSWANQRKWQHPAIGLLACTTPSSFSSTTVECVCWFNKRSK